MKWSYNRYRSTLCKEGKAFAIISPDGINALSSDAANELLADLNGVPPAKLTYPVVRKCKPLKKGDYVILPYAGPRYGLLYKAVNHSPTLGWTLKKIGRPEITYAHVTGHDRITPSRAARIIAGAKRKRRK